jgi:cell division protein FtsW
MKKLEQVKTGTQSDTPVKKGPSRAMPANQEPLIRVKRGADIPFLVIVILLLLIGTVMVFSASYAYAKEFFDGDSYYYARKQIAWACVSLLSLYIFTFIDYSRLRAWTILYSVVSFVLLVLVLFIGKKVHGATRWIELGPLNMQPSELVKLAMILFISDYAVRYQNEMHLFRRGIFPILCIVGAICAALYFEPHLSAIIIVLFLAFVLMYLGGAKVWQLMALAGSAALAAGIVFLGTSHGRARIEAWLNPEADPLGAGWQPLQSLLAIGSGGLWGVGLGQSRQKYLYLPEPQNDYIFAVLCEEMGFVFAVAVILLFLALIWRGFYIAKNAPTKYSSLIVYGIVTQVAIQVFLNIAVVTNVLPSTGVSLPFFSYGGTSLAIIMAEMGIVLNVSKYSFVEKG